MNAAPYTATVVIDRSAATVWQFLTEPTLMIGWMGDPEMQLSVDTSWEVNTPVIIRGVHHVPFENTGEVLACEKERKLKYSHLSSISRLPDLPQNHTTLEFVLVPAGNATQLTLCIDHFPTESIRKHLEFYWRGTLPRIRQAVEAGSKR